jgi:hypothetical protein
MFAPRSRRAHRFLAVCTAAPVVCAVSLGLGTARAEEATDELPVSVPSVVDGLPVRMSVIAPSADPPWTLRIENTGDQPVRIPADVRLLQLTLETGERGARTTRCELPRALRPARFPEARALVLGPGEVWQERFDPRLYCFGESADRLRGSTLVRASFGWKKPWRGAKPSEPFAAQSLKNPEAFTPLTELNAPSIVLAYRRDPDEPPELDLPPTYWIDADGKHHDESEAPVAAGGDPRPSAHEQRNGGPSGHGGRGRAGKPIRPEHTEPGASKRSNGKNGAGTSSGEPTKPAEPARGGEAATVAAPSAKAVNAGATNALAPVESTPEQPAAPTVDENAGRVDVFVRRYADAHAGRDVVVTIDAVNEGHRSLSAVLRGRMLSFTVEELGRDNRAVNTVQCSGSHKPHAIASEAVRSYRPGQKATIPLLLAEFCPHGTFKRPGLYRALPYIDTTVDGEALEEQAYIGQALARQSALIRVATGAEPFVAPPPRKLPPPGALPPERRGSEPGDDVQPPKTER